MRSPERIVAVMEKYQMRVLEAPGTVQLIRIERTVTDAAAVFCFKFGSRSEGAEVLFKSLVF
jgi:hypothetical protein